jgi:hypothetical protein
MKAKISLTNAELCSILSTHYNFQIESVEILPASSLTVEIDKVIAPFLKVRQPINAIKALREMAVAHQWNPIGLAEAKWAIDNYSLFMDYIQRKGCLPSQYPPID